MLQGSPGTAPPQLIRGTSLQLVGTHGPLQIYIDFTSTNKVPDYAVFDGNQCVVHRENVESNMIETTHFEEGFSVMVTKRDTKGNIVERMVSYDEGSMRSKYTYIDKDGDGLWDVFLDHAKHIYYVRTNHCWVARQQE